MRRRQQFATRLAGVLLAGPWQRDAMRDRLADWLGPRSPKSQDAIIQQTLDWWQAPYPPGPPTLSDFLSRLGTAETLHASVRRRKVTPSIPLTPQAFVSAPAFADCDLPVLDGPMALAGWLGLGTAELDWFADPADLNRLPARKNRRHYEFHWIPKRTGGYRLLEAPLPRMKAIQRQILDQILAPVPAHAAAFGFVVGRCCLDAAARHAAEELVITLDLSDFFTSVQASRVHAIFRTLGYPWAVARLLTGLVTLRTPLDAISTSPVPLPWNERRQLLHAHLPQGAPTSPTLANLAARGLDHRLEALARHRDLAYSRYADDLAFSGDRAGFGPSPQGFVAAVSAIARDERFEINHAKTRIMPQSIRQRVTGLTVNRHVNLARGEFDRLKAILTNCARHGPESQNRDGHPTFRAHLDGKVGWAEQVNPHRGAKLREIFDRIVWPL